MKMLHGIKENIFIDFENHPEFKRDVDHSLEMEYFWASPVGFIDSQPLLEIDFPPLWSKGIALGDTVLTDEDGEIQSVFHSSGFKQAIVTFSDEYVEASDWPIPAVVSLENAKCETAWIVGGNSYAVSVPADTIETSLMALLTDHDEKVELSWV